MNAGRPNLGLDGHTLLRMATVKPSEAMNTAGEGESSLSNSHIEAMMGKYYREFYRHLSAFPVEEKDGHSGVSRASQKLSKLSMSQFWELSTDTYDALLCRKLYEAASKEIGEGHPPVDVSHLLSDNGLPPKRKAARQKITELAPHRFRHLVADISDEVDNRFPTIVEEVHKSFPEPVTFGAPVSHVSLPPPEQKSSNANSAYRSAMLCNECATAFENYPQQGNQHQRTKGFSTETAATQVCSICKQALNQGL